MQELFLFIFDCNFCQDSNGAEPNQDCDISYFVFHGSNVSERLLVSRYFFNLFLPCKQTPCQVLNRGIQEACQL